MPDSGWSACRARLIALQEKAASAEGVASARYEEDLVAAEEELRRIGEGAVVVSRSEALDVLQSAYDIATVEALVPMRHDVLPHLIEAVIQWINREISCGRS